MSGQSLILRTCGLLSSGNKFLLANKLNHVNIFTPCAGMRTDAKTPVTVQIPEKPKKPLSAFFRFVAEKRPVILSQNPSLKLTETIKLLSEQWHELSAENKQKYQIVALKEKEKFNEEFKKYQAKLTGEQVELLKQIQADKRKIREKRRINKENRESEKPKRPVTAYARFLKENYVPEKDFKENIVAVKAKWLALSDTEKQKYHDQFLKEKQVYATQVMEWEKRMIAEGKNQLVRSSTLQELTTKESKSKSKKLQESKTAKPQ